MVLGIVLENKRSFTIIHMRGELLSGNLRILEEVLFDQFARGTKNLALDMNELEHIEATAAKKLIEYKKDAEMRKISLSLFCSSPSNQKTLKDNGVDVFCKITTQRSMEEEHSGKRKFSFPGLNLQLNVKL
ncbi:MAG: STAS domain-containing protein [Spirochaetes bacterium]|nr:STAS domain-containing protein [Spirochaetota bacterium]